ncbi:MAG: hypothetical protein AAF627_05680 [Myxococcota bacterium]
MMQKMIGLAIGLAALTAACGESDDPSAPTRRDMGGGSGTVDAGGNGGGDPLVFGAPEVVDGLSSSDAVGDFAVARIGPDGVIGVGYAVDLLTGSQVVRVAERNGPSDWNIEDAAFPASDIPNAPGSRTDAVGFDYVDGRPAVVFWGGDMVELPGELSPYEGPTDLQIAERNGGTWATRTLVQNSGQAAGTCKDGVEYCNRGTVIGSQPAMVARPGGGFAAIYRDIHFGFGTEDFRRSDAEIITEGAGAYHRIADVERSGPLSTGITTFDDGRVVAAYFIDNPDRASERGVWVAIESGDGFELSQVDDAGTNQRVSVATDNGTIWVAFYDVDDTDLIVGSTDDEGETWNVERVDDRGITGQYPSIAIDQEGRPVVAYAFCASVSAGCGSNNPSAEVRVARLENGAWVQHLVDDGQGLGNVGAFNSLIVLPDGRLGIAFQDTRNNDLLFALEEE